MKRKIVQQGESTLMISLPAKWARHHKLCKGGEIEVEETDRQLIISVGKGTIKKEVNFTLKEDAETSVRATISNAYRLGYDKITINYTNESTYRYIERTVRNLIGIEIVSKGKTWCIIENISEPAKDKYDVMHQKIFYNISTLFDILLQEIRGETSEEDYREVERRIKQYDDFCKRILEKYDLTENIQLPWSFQNELIHGQRELYLSIRHGIHKEETVQKEIIEYFNEIRTLFELLKEAYAKKEISLVEKIHAFEKEVIYTKGYALLNNPKIKNHVFVHHLISAARNFYLASSPLLGIILMDKSQNQTPNNSSLDL